MLPARDPVAIPYRTAAPPAEARILEVRPESAFAIAVAIGLSVMFSGAGMSVLAFGLLATKGDGTGVFIALGALSTLAGVLMAYIAYRGFATKIRFVVDSDALTIEWHRRGRVVKSERVACADVVDVCILDEPASEGVVYGVAIGMRSGQIWINDDARSSRRRSYEPMRDRIAEFLGVPARP